MSEIIVGIDESPGAQDALEFAARLAEVSGASLRLASAFPYSDTPSRARNEAFREELESRAEALLDLTATATDAPVGGLVAIEPVDGFCDSGVDALGGRVQCTGRRSDHSYRY